MLQRDRALDDVFIDQLLSSTTPVFLRAVKNLDERQLPVVLLLHESAGQLESLPVKIGDCAVLADPIDRDKVAAAIESAGLELPVLQTVESPGVDSVDQPSKASRAHATPEPACEVSDGIRVLVVDPAAPFRQLLGKVIRETPGFALAATAQDGAAALEKIARLKPDVVTMELEMPVLDGFETLKQIRANWPELPVVVFSTMCRKGGHRGLPDPGSQ